MRLCSTSVERCALSILDIGFSLSLVDFFFSNGFALLFVSGLVLNPIGISEKVRWLVGRLALLSFATDTKVLIALEDLCSFEVMMAS